MLARAVVRLEFDGTPIPTRWILPPRAINLPICAAHVKNLGLVAGSVIRQALCMQQTDQWHTRQPPCAHFRRVIGFFDAKGVITDIAPFNPLPPARTVFGPDRIWALRGALIVRLRPAPMTPAKMPRNTAQFGAVRLRRTRRLAQIP